jgi:hypothetical protein
MEANATFDREETKAKLKRFIWVAFMVAKQQQRD